jgi:signal transduction histidine kinase
MARLYAQSDDLREADRKRREQTAKLVASSEDKIRRIARDIYGESIQTIAAVGNSPDILQRALIDPAHPGTLTELEQPVHVSIARLRRLALELGPHALGQDDGR